MAARRVQLTQTRLRELIEANRSVAHYRDLSALLSGIVNSAVALVAAGSGVIEVIATREHPLRRGRCGTVAFEVLYAGRNGRYDFSAEDEQLLGTFGDMAAIALAIAGFREKGGVSGRD